MKSQRYVVFLIILFSLPLAVSPFLSEAKVFVGDIASTDNDNLFELSISVDLYWHSGYNTINTTVTLLHLDSQCSKVTYFRLYFRIGKRTEYYSNPGTLDSVGSSCFLSTAVFYKPLYGREQLSFYCKHTLVYKDSSTERWGTEWNKLTHINADTFFGHYGYILYTLFAVVGLSGVYLVYWFRHRIFRKSHVQILKCSECGYEIQADDNFCAECGTKVG